MDLEKMMREAQELQKALEKAQDELGKVDVSGSSGGGLIEVVMNAQGKIKDVKIKKEAVNPNDVETLEDLVLSAVRDATDKAFKVSQEKLQRVTQNKSFPS